MKSHTLRTIADEMDRDKRTVQSWYQRAKSEHGELGELVDGVRCFDDSERSVLASYAGEKPAAKEAPHAPTTAAAVAVGNHQIVLAPPQLPAQYSLEVLRGGEAVSFEDPLAVAAQFLQTADLLESAMGADIADRQSRLEATQKAKDAISQKRQKLELEARLYQLQTQNLDGALSAETAALQAELGKLQQFTQPAAASPGVASPGA